MAWLEEEYRKVRGSEADLVRGFNVHDALSEHEAIDFTRTSLVNAGEDFWPPFTNGDYMTTNDDIVVRKWLTDVGVEEVHLNNTARNTATSIFKTQARYSYRASCPLIDFNVRGQQVQTTQGLDGLTNPADPTGPKITPPPRTKRYPASARDEKGAIEPTADGGSAKGTSALKPNTQFTMTWNPVTAIKDVEFLKYAEAVQTMVGTVNASPFLRDSSQGFFGYDEGSLRLDGWTGKMIDQKNWLYEYRFEFTYRPYRTSPSSTPDTIGGITITGGDKYGGHEHLWIRWEPFEQSAAGDDGVVPSAKAIYFETIYDQSDFYNLFRAQGKSSGQRLVSPQCPGFREFTSP